MRNTLYDVLGVDDHAEPEDVSAAFHEKKAQLEDASDPDLQNEMKLVQQAYAILSDPAQRAQYDQSLKSEAIKDKTIIYYEPKSSGSGWALKVLLVVALAGGAYLAYARFGHPNPKALASMHAPAESAPSDQAAGNTSPAENRPDAARQDAAPEQAPDTAKGPADVNDVNAVPLPAPGAQRVAYESFLAHPPSRAFVICNDGRVLSFYGNDAFVHEKLAALPSGCAPYAINKEVVWAGGQAGK